MKDHLRYTVSLLVGLLIIGILCASEAGPHNRAWQYAVYEVQQVYNEEGDLTRQHFYWYTRGATRVADRRAGVNVVSAKGKYGLFNKLGAQNSQVEHHELLLWNHLGAQGWEYVEQFQKSVEGRPGFKEFEVRTQTVFRRPLDS